jgi:hypothetical protein
MAESTVVAQRAGRSEVQELVDWASRRTRTPSPEFRHEAGTSL